MSETPEPEPAQSLSEDMQDLSLSREMGPFYVAEGAGSFSSNLSKPAESRHERVASRILTNSSASHALDPSFLPPPPTEPPKTPRIDEPLSVSSPALGTTANVASEPAPEVDCSKLTASITPIPSNVHSPTLPGLTGLKSESNTPEICSTAATPGVSRTASPLPGSKAGHSKPHEREKKSSLLNKFFGHNTPNGDKKHSPISSTPEPTKEGALLGRKPSKKDIEKSLKDPKETKDKDEDEDHLKVPGNGSETRKEPRPRSGSGKSENNVATALNDFMRGGRSRKSDKSDDGNSYYGQSQPSLSKKYGVAGKVAIGKGATATVKLIHRRDRASRDTLYAIKEFRKRRKNETEKEHVKKLTSEFCISSTLHHPNIVETVDLIQDEQNHWCEVMEYCPGGDLYAAIKKGTMTIAEINSYFKQIISGIVYLHSIGVAHRDIKPENLLLDAKGHLKITDFGVSDVFRMCWEKTIHMSKGLCGSEPYIAPEQFTNKEYDARLVDVWATAVVFYCMNFQELPWRVAKSSDPSFGPYLIAYKNQASPSPLSNIVPPECRALIKRMLDPEPKTRATTEYILADSWFQTIIVIPPMDDVLPASTPQLS